MKLEVTTRTPTGEPRPTPLLFVHGADCATWVWVRHFLPFFADRGYEAHALSLRGHGASEGHELLKFCACGITSPTWSRWPRPCLARRS